MDLPVWLFAGPEAGERKLAVERVKAEIKKNYGEVDCHTMYAGDTPMSEAVSVLQNGSLFSAARIIVLKNAEAIKKKEDIDILCSWIKSSLSENAAFLILISHEISINKTIENLIPKSKKQIFWELFENKKQDWIRNFFRKSGLKIDSDAINVLLELVENNTDMLKTVCSHLVLFFQKDAFVSAADVETLLTHNKEETPFSLFDVLTHSNLEQALAIAQKLMLSKESSAIQIIGGLTYCFRRLTEWHKAHKGGQYLDDFALKKIGFTSKTAVSQYRRAAGIWNYEDTERIIACLNRTDSNIRSLGMSFQQTLLELCLYQIVCKKGSPLNAYSTSLQN